MSTIASVLKDGLVAVCTDTRISSGPTTVEQRNHKGLKAFKWGPNIISRTGWQKYNLMLKTFFADKEEVLLDSEIVINDLFMEFWDLSKERFGIVSNQSNESDTPWLNFDAVFQIVNHSGIFHVHQDISITHHDYFHSIGSGNRWAMGAMSVLYDMDFSAQEIAEKAVATANLYDTRSGGELITLTL